MTRTGRPLRADSHLDTKGGSSHLERKTLCLVVSECLERMRSILARAMLPRDIPSDCTDNRQDGCRRIGTQDRWKRFRQGEPRTFIVLLFVRAEGENIAIAYTRPVLRCFGVPEGALVYFHQERRIMFRNWQDVPANPRQLLISIRADVLGASARRSRVADAAGSLPNVSATAFSPLMMRSLVRGLRDHPNSSSPRAALPAAATWTSVISLTISVTVASNGRKVNIAASD